MLTTFALFFKEIMLRKLKNQANGDFTNICKWVMCNKFSVNFAKDKIKSIISASKRKMRRLQN